MPISNVDSHITDRSSLYRIALRVGTTSLRYSLSLDYQKVRYTLKGVGGGGGSHMKRAGMLVVSLRGGNFGFWSHLGCPGQNASIFSRKGLF